MTSIDELVEKARANGGLIGENSEKNKDILLVPRKLVQVRKVEVGDGYTYFIEKRLDERATRLDAPTEVSNLALSSGLRSVIIKEKDGKYLKLKGVAVNNHLNRSAIHNEYYGLSQPFEAFAEMFTCASLEQRPYIPMKTRHIDVVLMPKIIPSNASIPYNFLNTRIVVHGKMNRSSIMRDKLARLGGSICDRLDAQQPDRYYTAIPAFEIKGDTRLDELIYALTQRDLGGQAKARDELLYHISFLAGMAKAEFTLDGFAWGGALNHTNAHIGNFVVYQDKGAINVGIADLGQALTLNELGALEEPKAEFQSRKLCKLIAHSKAEVESFAEDLDSGYTFSTSRPLRYRHFSEDFSACCATAIFYGYAYGLYTFVKSKIEPTFDASKLADTYFKELKTCSDLFGDLSAKSSTAEQVRAMYTENLKKKKPELSEILAEMLGIPQEVADAAVQQYNSILQDND